MSQLAAKSTAEYSIEILSGPDKGSIFQIVSPVVTIGRASTNDIVLDRDPKCSRNHAEIHIQSSGISIKALNNNNPIIVDGQKGLDLLLRHDSKIKIGNTKLLFQAAMFIKEQTQHLALTSQNFNSGNEIAFKNSHAELGPVHPNKDLGHLPSHKKNGSPIFRFSLIAIILLVLFLALSENEQSIKEKLGVRSREQVEQDIEANKKLTRLTREQRNQSGQNSIQFQEAQALYIKGFRDYKKGQYERALSSFEACISVFPQHKLCQTYLRLSEKKFQELVQYHMILGAKYKEKGLYRACMASYKNVLVMVKSPQSKVYKEALSIYELCKAQLEGKY